MFRHTLTCGGLLLTAVACLALAGTPAMAQQQGWPLTQGSYNGFTEGSTYAPAYAEPAPTYLAPYTVPSGTSAAAATEGQTQIRSFYPSAAGEQYGTLSGQPEGSRSVRINVAVPANAEILFGNFKTTQRGAQRAFVSPPLAPGGDYTYDITAKWQEGGREVVRTRQITVHAGDVLNVNF